VHMHTTGRAENSCINQDEFVAEWV